MKNKIVSVILLCAIFTVLSFADIVTAADNTMIAGYIWEDNNGNGMHEPDDEATIDGVTINVLSTSGALQNSAVTTGGGKFELSISEGDHILQIILPDRYNTYVIRAADYVHGVLDHNTSGGRSVANEFLFNAIADRFYTVNVAVAWESDVVDAPDDQNPPRDDVSGDDETGNKGNGDSGNGDNENGDNDSDNGGTGENITPVPTTSAETGDSTVTPTPTEQPNDSSGSNTNSPSSTARPTPRPTTKPSDSSGGGGGGGGGGGAVGGDLQNQQTDASPSPSPSPIPSALPEEQVSPELNKTDHLAYVAGYPDGTVMPESNITRQEVASLFFRLLTYESQNYFYSYENNFSDVPSTLWSNDAISTMTNAGIISGYTDGTFLPENNITRAEFATIAVKFDNTGYTGSDRFDDISGHWANAYINRAAQLGWISGYDGGIFKPDAYITRAEAMTIINNILVRHVEPADMLVIMRKWTDNTPDKWYYSAVQEATNSHYYERLDDGYHEAWTEMR